MKVHFVYVDAQKRVMRSSSRARLLSNPRRVKVPAYGEQSASIKLDEGIAWLLVKGLGLSLETVYESCFRGFLPVELKGWYSIDLHPCTLYEIRPDGFKILREDVRPGKRGFERILGEAVTPA